jgi:hypothetical protein
VSVSFDEKGGELMGSRTPSRPCLICGEHETRSNAGICYRCRPHPRVHVDGDRIYISGIGALSHDAAYRLSWAISDALSQQPKIVATE